jgi:DNA polymerase III alpha subunit (gram-positive type)
VRHESVAWTDPGRRYFAAYQNRWEALAVSASEAYDRVSSFCDALPCREVKVVGHNVGFDMAFLKKLIFDANRGPLPKLSHRSVDTHTLLQALVWLGRIPEICTTSDGALRHFCIDIPERDRHTALGDARAAVRLLNRIAQEFAPDLDRAAFALG